MKFITKTYFLKITPELLTLVEEDCRRISSRTCVILCYYKTIGVIDEQGGYVESNATEFMNIVLMDYGLPVDEIKNNQESKLSQIAKTCNRVNDHISNGCQRGEEVATCLNDELKKATPEILKFVKENCRNSTTNKSCVMHCYYETVGIIDEQGRYVESKMTQFIENVILPRLPTRLHELETLFRHLPKQCNRVNKQITKGCLRVRDVDKCYFEESFKIEQMADEIMDTIFNDCKRTSGEDCASLCAMKKYDVVDKDDQYVESEMATYYFGKWFSNNLYLNVIEEREANNTVQTCISASKHITERCEQAEQVNKCLDFESKKYRYEWEL